MLEEEIAREIIGLVPHWYQAQCGSVQFSLLVGSQVHEFYNHAPLTSALATFLSHVQNRVKEVQLQYFEAFPGLIDVFLESLTIEWLRMHSPHTDWKRLVRYLDELSRRTFENQPVALNLIIRPGKGDGDITFAQLQKIFDQLASSPMTFLVVDPDLRLLDYGEVRWADLRGELAYKFYPEALHPLHSVLAEGDMAVQLTPLGDLMFMSAAGLIAARRKRKWQIYDMPSFRDSLAACLDHAAVAANLLELVVDLSFRRHGSLLIYDPRHATRPHIRNEASIVYRGWRKPTVSGLTPPTGQSLIGRSIRDLAMGAGLSALRWKRRLMELTRVDGAMIFDEHRILAVGAIIETHPRAGNQLGARATAARSAYLWGAKPVKVSSDGDVTVHFTSRDGQAQCDAEFHFL